MINVAVHENVMQVLGDGWVRIAWSDRTYTVLVKSVMNEGRRVITDLVVRDQRVDSNTLKDLRIGWIDTALNVRLADEDVPDDELDSRPVNIGGLIDGILADVDRYIAEPPDSGFPIAIATFDAASNRPRLIRPDGSNPDAFYRTVAEAYLDTLRRTSTIAPVLAEEAGVPVATVHRWIGEARRRGFLPRARQGRAG